MGWIESGVERELSGMASDYVIGGEGGLEGMRYPQGAVRLWINRG